MSVRFLRLNKMIEFLEKLQDDCIAMRVGFIKNNTNDFYAGYESSIKRIDSLGENANRMLEIGLLQDELASLGFKPFQEDDHEAEIMYFRLPIGNDETIEVNFNRTVEVGIGMFWCSDLTSKSEFAYKSPTFREDVMEKIKELIK